MKIVITGANSQLGQELIKHLKDEYEVIPFTKQQLDITNRTNIKEIIQKIQPEYLINTAAYTQVDLCEKNSSEAYLINGIGPYYLACEAKNRNVKFIHISTDYVFDGQKNVPYVEEDVPNPETVYGKSKLLGEELSLVAYESTTIIRTSWLYGHGGKNFVNTIKKLINQARNIRVVHDQYGCPTYTKDLCIAIKQLLNKPNGIYHISNSGSCSWFEFATEIGSVLNSQTTIIPVTTKEYGLKTPRPMYSVLSHQKINANGIFIRNWKEGLYEYLKKEGDDSGD
ncbi:dTDP-4-dehydrorhamnose reductase [Bacillus sp. JJ722]|uniref:dTDP-4-dehydrorhamnose reductase n=1 Tax=Bacillus sp. JJ722 TaxID=3122973 RepID=UPI002FFFCB96